MFYILANQIDICNGIYHMKIAKHWYSFTSKQCVCEEGDINKIVE
jgi:hypothetical protein